MYKLTYVQHKIKLNYTFLRFYKNSVKKKKYKLRFWKKIQNFYISNKLAFLICECYFFSMRPSGKYSLERTETDLSF